MALHVWASNSSSLLFQAGQASLSRRSRCRTIGCFRRYQLLDLRVGVILFSPFAWRYADRCICGLTLQILDVAAFHDPRIILGVVDG